MERVEHPEDAIVEWAVNRMVERSKVGIVKYQCDMENSSLDMLSAQDNALEELMDAVVYQSLMLHRMKALDAKVAAMEKELSRLLLVEQNYMQLTAGPVIFSKIPDCKCPDCATRRAVQCKRSH